VLFKSLIDIKGTDLSSEASSVGATAHFWFANLPYHVAPKGMPPSYFHRNYRRHQEHKNTVSESYKTLFFKIVTTIGCTFSPAMNKSLNAAVIKNCNSGDDSLFHSWYNSIIARRILPIQSIFHQPEQTEVRRYQNQTIW